MIVIYEAYYHFLNKQKKINKTLRTVILILNAYSLFISLKNNLPINIDEVGIPWLIYFCWKIFVYLFYRLFGKYWILKYQRWQTKEFQWKVMDKNIKAAGKRGGFKDTSQSGIVTDFANNCRKDIKKKLSELKIQLYKFDLKKIKKAIKNDIKIFDVASKEIKKKNFSECVANNDLFLKNKYKSLAPIIIEDQENTEYIRLSKSKYVITDSVNFKHLLDLLYDYFYFTWRLEIDIWVISNQPYFQDYNFKTKKYKMAKIYSPDLKATKNRTVKTSENRKVVEYISIENMISEDYICFWESEADIWWNNIEHNVKQNIQERGMRWGEAAVRHINGENVMSIRNGQVASRTIKIQRDLEESFYSVTRCVKVNGGAKRIFFIKLFMRIMGPILTCCKGLKTKCLNKIKILEMSGWLKLETVFSRSEQINYQAPGISLNQLLDRENPLYMNQYQTTLVFNIRDCWGKYNTHYLEYIGETTTKHSEAVFKELPEWTPDLKLREEHIIEMNYDTVDIFNIPEEKKYKNNRKYKKIEKENKNAMRL